MKIKHKKISVTIGIPSYNEEKNLGGLINDLLKQRENRIVLDRIIIVSDGSTDNTVSSVRHFTDARIKVYHDTERQGKAVRENEILRKASSEIVVLLDADIVIDDPDFLNKLIQPLIEKRAEMTSSSIRPVSPRTFFEEILFVSIRIKEILCAQFKNGNNVLTCYGPARAFAKKFYRKLSFLTSDGEDMYSYFSCLDSGYRFMNIPEAVTYYRLPSTFADHCKQSIRYHRAKKDMNKYFNKKTVTGEQVIPLSVYMKTFFLSLPILLTHPVQVVLYVLVLGYIRIISLTKYQFRDNWNVTTSKLVRNHI